eukprot:gene14477-biopygen6619
MSTGVPCVPSLTLAHLATPVEEFSDAQKRSLAILEKPAMRRPCRRSVEQSQSADTATRSNEQDAKGTPPSAGTGAVTLRSAAVDMSDALEEFARDREGHAQTQQRQHGIPPVPNDESLNAMRFTDLVVLAVKCGLPGLCLVDEASAREGLRTYRDADKGVTVYYGEL